MPFSIELSTDEVVIKIQIVKKAINIYFSGDKAKAIEERKKWSHLGKQFIDTIPEFGSVDGILLPSSRYHLKQEHTNIYETKLSHLHVLFLVEVTPTIFSYYLNGLYQQQTQHGKEYAFFQDFSEVTQIVAAFEQCYKDYSQSALGAEYEEETRLSPQEQEAHQEEVRKAKSEMQPQSISAFWNWSFFSLSFSMLKSNVQTEVTSSNEKDKDITFEL